MCKGSHFFAHNEETLVIFSLFYTKKKLPLLVGRQSMMIVSDGF